MTKRIISEIFFLTLVFISAIFIMAFLELLNFGGMIKNKFLKVLIFENFIENPFQGLFPLLFILFFVIKLRRQKKLKFNDYVANYSLIFTGFALLYFFSRFIYNAQRRKKMFISELNFNAQKTNVFIKSDQYQYAANYKYLYSTHLKYYDYEIIILSGLLLIVGFITVKTILKTKEIVTTTNKELCLKTNKMIENFGSNIAAEDKNTEMNSKIDITEFRNRLKKNTKIGTPSLKIPWGILSIFADNSKCFYGNFNNSTFELIINSNYSTPFYVLKGTYKTSKESLTINYGLEPIGKFRIVWIKYFPIIALFICNSIFYFEAKPPTEDYIVVNLFIVFIYFASRLNIKLKNRKLKRKFNKIFEIVY